MTKKIIAIWAQDEAGLIGRDNRLPWHLPKEWQHFKETTMHQALVMGRVTFDGMNRRLLPGRETLILSRQPDQIDTTGVTILSSPEAVLDWFKQQDKNLYVVGGASIYQAFAPYYDQLVVTRVAGEFAGDTHFPPFDWSAYRPIAEQTFAADEQNSHAFTVTTYERIKED
ncbi:dihydrofolate reductase [Streptococcus entericus]|uniref:dihydrofolate reductase n=1 Tax=Streptococcus entericus TaxID=155680 RepID=UPI00035DFA4C|nr:dihydrofolate reductase [Streptococcus entericus]